MIVHSGAAGHVLRRDLTNLVMGDGAGKPCRVIDNGVIRLYVGIGWIDERDAKPGDEDRYPVVAEGNYSE